MKMSTSTLAVRLAAGLATCASLLACNDHPIEPLDQNLSAVNRVENRLPAKTKLDFLFVIDNSNSMCEEQQRLAENFKLFSNFLFDELQAAADYRIAVVSTDIGQSVSPVVTETRGQFLYQPVDPNAISCGTNGEAVMADTADCEPPGSDINPIISSEVIDAQRDPNLSPAEQNAALKAELERQFKCRATIGTNGYLYEKGLEAMRLALSCNGPNAEKFSQCCINFGSPNSYYNPGCVIPDGQPEPEFLRPDANLIVIFITDEDDCSTPGDAPDQTSRLICRTGGTVDNDADGVPDIYAEYCRGISAQECYQRECGQYVAEGPAKCREERCDIAYVAAAVECDWYRSRLTPIREYRDFLQSLKSRPLDQILVAPIVGFRAYNTAGDELRYNNAPPVSEECKQNPVYDDTCCPDGNCQGITIVKPTCNLPNKGILAYPGTRYLQFAEAMGDNGLGCPSGNEPVIDPIAETIMSQPGLQEQDCVNICVEDFIAPLEAIKDRVANLLNTYCIDRLPACIVPSSTNEAGQVVPERPCEGAELENPAYYPIRVSQRCTSANCDEVLPLQTLPRNAWELRLGLGTCAAQITLNGVPPAGSEVFVEFLVDANNTQSTSQNTSQSTPEGAAGAESEPPSAGAEPQGGAPATAGMPSP